MWQIRSRQARKVSLLAGLGWWQLLWPHGCFPAPAALNSSRGTTSCADCRVAHWSQPHVAPGQPPAGWLGSLRLEQGLARRLWAELRSCRISAATSRVGLPLPPASRGGQAQPRFTGKMGGGGERASTHLQKAGNKRTFCSFPFLKYGIHRGSSSFSNWCINSQSQPVIGFAKHRGSCNVL